MFQKFFSPDNLFFQCCGKVFDLVVLSTIFYLLCIPVVTAGPAAAALYYAVVKSIRRNEGDPYKNFFHSFKENFKVGAASGVLALLGLGVLWLGWRVLGLIDPADTLSAVMRWAYLVALLVPVGAALYLGPILSRFSFGVGGLFSAALKLSLRHLPSTVAVTALTVGMVGASLYFLLPLFAAPAVTALLSSFLLERIFKKYIPAPEEEAEEEAGETPWYLK